MNAVCVGCQVAAGFRSRCQQGVQPSFHRLQAAFQLGICLLQHSVLAFEPGQPAGARIEFHIQSSGPGWGITHHAVFRVAEGLTGLCR
ncbi:hypothetical protein ADK57_03315 [Streptomyces sp. MMG1533]|nr:hypothetical protein ADK57_03315 [Streptomyces sp. MMG1533]